MEESETQPAPVGVLPAAGYGADSEWPACVPGWDALPEHLQRAVADSPLPTPELAARLRGWLPPAPLPAAAPVLQPAA